MWGKFIFLPPIGLLLAFGGMNELFGAAGWDFNTHLTARVVLGTILTYWAGLCAVGLFVKTKYPEY